MNNIYFDILKELEQKQQEDNWVNLGNVDLPENIKKRRIYSELEKKGLIVYLVPFGGYIIGKRDGTTTRLSAEKGNLKAKLTFEGFKYLNNLQNNKSGNINLKGEYKNINMDKNRNRRTQELNQEIDEILKQYSHLYKIAEKGHPDHLLTLLYIDESSNFFFKITREDTNGTHYIHYMCKPFSKDNIKEGRKAESLSKFASVLKNWLEILKHYSSTNKKLNLWQRIIKKKITSTKRKMSQAERIVINLMVIGIILAIITIIVMIILG